jgi:hypothetical protein
MNFLHLNFINLSCYGLSYICGILLIAGGFWRYDVPRWVCIAFWMVVPLCFAWATLGFILMLDSSLSPLAQRTIFNCKTGCGGANIGILLLLIFSGELIRRWKRVNP